MRYIKSTAIFAAWLAVAVLNFGPVWPGRNGSGTYTIPNTFVPGATITAAGHNQNYADIATELTNSVAADGQTVLTGALKLANGTVSTPALTFASDTDSGFYRIGAGNLGLALDGSKVVDYATTGATVTGTFSATTIQQGGFTLVPPGAVFFTASATIPSGYLPCDGAAVSRTTYANLFTALSTTYGVGNGTTTFNVPDVTGRTLAGKEGSATRLTSAIGGVDGATLGSAAGLQSRTILQANLPSYNLNIGSLNTVVSGGTKAGDSDFAAATGAGATVPRNSSAISVSIGGSLPSGGSDTALATVQPTIVMNCILKY